MGYTVGKWKDLDNFICAETRINAAGRERPCPMALLDEREMREHQLNDHADAIEIGRIAPKPAAGESKQAKASGDKPSD
jgi:hypothetical protein